MKGNEKEVVNNEDTTQNVEKESTPAAEATENATENTTEGAPANPEA